jgi:hypothetical protein
VSKPLIFFPMRRSMTPGGRRSRLIVSISHGREISARMINPRSSHNLWLIQ